MGLRCAADWIVYAIQLLFSFPPGHLVGIPPGHLLSLLESHLVEPQLNAAVSVPRHNTLLLLL